MFHPEVGTPIVIGGHTWRFTAHPAAPSITYAQAGRAGTVYQIADGHGRLAALKVFNPLFCDPALVDQALRLSRFTALPGLRACQRAILTPEWHAPLLEQHPDLQYAALMDWIEGKPWFNVILERQPLSREKCAALGAALTDVLVHMDQESVAHGDLSGANVLVNGLGSRNPQVQLVDVEQLYAPTMDRPARVLEGSPGYAHATAKQQLWQANMDRFAGTILLSEILGWCDERVRLAADEATYFAENELQQDCERYRLLHTVLAERWGADAANLLQQAWESDTLDQCPPFAVGPIYLPKPPPPHPDPVPSRDTERDKLMAAAAAAEQGGRWENALVLYRRLLAGWPNDSQQSRWSAAVRTAEGKIHQQARQKRLVALVGVVVLMLLLGVGGVIASGLASGGDATPTQVAEVAPEPTTITATQINSVEPTTAPEEVTVVDSDGDGLSDEEEREWGTKPDDPDSDGDGRSDSEEVRTPPLTNPLDPDSDADGLADGQELQNYGSDPNNSDTDSDGLTDGEEVLTHDTKPDVADTDSDGLSDGQEILTYGTEPNDDDTDNDGLSDGQEATEHYTDPTVRDSDGDGLSDGEEVLTTRTDPNDPDTDGDDMDDGGEVALDRNPREADAPEPASSISALRLINATTDRFIGDLEDGDTVSLRNGSNLNIEAVVNNSVGSVTFLLDGRRFCLNDSTRCVENSGPFAMAGNGGRDYYDWNWTSLIGSHTIEAIPCAQDNGEGECGPPLVVSFTVTR